MQINYGKSALKALRGMDKSTRDRIVQSINGLNKQPPEGDIKPLQGSPGDYRLRVGKYRIIYYFKDDSIMVADIGTRGDIYK